MSKIVVVYCFLFFILYLVISNVILHSFLCLDKLKDLICIVNFSNVSRYLSSASVPPSRLMK